MKSITRTLMLMSLVLAAPLAVHAEDVQQIMEKFDKVTRDSYSSALLRMELSTCKYRMQSETLKCTEKPRQVSVELVQKDFGPELRDSRILADVIAPISDRGIGTLTYQYAEQGKDKDMWLYLPALGKVKRLISNSDGAENFFGSEFLTENMENRKLQDYTYRIIEESTFNSRPVWAIEMIPTPAKQKKSPFSKIVSYIDKERYVPLKESFYNHNNKLYLQEVWHEYENVNGVWIGTKVSMNNFISQRVSQLRMEAMKFDIEIPSEFFTQRSLTDFSYREGHKTQLRALYN